LTHHKVDDEAGVARGSTSYYYRTRLALTEAVMERVVTLDMQDFAAVFADDAQPLASMAELIHDWLVEPALARTRARHELFLIASREPTIAARVAQVRQVLTESTASAIKGLIGNTLSDSAALEAARTGMWLVNGLMFTAVRENKPPPIASAIQRILAVHLTASFQLAEAQVG
jgi:AcrR family transcriptional regulator